MLGTVYPQNYHSDLDLIGTQRGIKLIKDFFEQELSRRLNLTRVSAPLFVRGATGMNDNLSGVETPVAFMVNEDGERVPLEIVQSLAKWKRHALGLYGFKPGSGLYTDMNAIRPCEVQDNTHSIYVDQWDWELVMREDERNETFLRKIVDRIFSAFRDLDCMLGNELSNYHSLMPEDIFFVSSQELEDLYPSLTAKEREREICRDKKAVFISQIGAALRSGKPHDGRAPDYDDWDLNGDILFWNPVLNDALELSSMGIRVSPESLKRQLQIAGAEERAKFDFHAKLLRGELPQTVGGGIGQSRICMFFMQKAHVGEVQVSVWPQSMRDDLLKNGIFLL